MTSPYSTGRRGVAYGSEGAIARGKAIKGADDLLKLSKRLKAAGQTELRKELHKEMRKAAKPLVKKVKDGAAERIGEHGGGIEDHYAKKPVRAQVRTGAKTSGVRVVMPKTDPRVDSQGRVYHPVYGRRPGVVQTVPGVKGFFSESLKEGSGEVREELRRTLAAFTERIARD